MRDIWADHVPPTPKDPRVELSFGCQPYGANTDNCKSIHPHGPIDTRDGSSIMAACCHRFGKEDHPALKRDRRTDPTPEPREVPAAPADPKAKPTRKQRRAAKFAAGAAGKRERRDP